MYNCLYFPAGLDYCASVGFKETPWIGNQSAISSDSLLFVKRLCPANTTKSGVYRKCSGLFRCHCTLRVGGGSVMCHQLEDIVTHSEGVRTRRCVTHLFTAQMMLDSSHMPNSFL